MITLVTTFLEEKANFEDNDVGEPGGLEMSVLLVFNCLLLAPSKAYIFFCYVPLYYVVLLGINVHH